ncbi:MAG: radical SAM protein [Crocinitomix sp.]|nr:radical SAM protein [Crocinitomix sp.]
MENTDICLINMPYLSQGGDVMRPLGLACIGSYLVTKGYSVKGYDFSYSMSSPENLIDKYDLLQYDRVGLSFYNTNASYSFQFARTLKKMKPDIIIIAGGPHVSAIYERLFTSHPEIDIIVRNEGEFVLEEVLKNLDANKPLNEVKGIAFHENGKTIVTPAADRIAELDNLPTPVFTFEGGIEDDHVYFDRVAGKTKKALGVVSSRSCPYNCSFCAIILIGRQWRKCSTPKVIADIRKQEAYDKTEYEHIYFLDANFFVSKQRAIEVSEELIKHNPNITFSFSTRANQVVKAGVECFKELYKRGLRAVEIGIESGSDEALARYGKDSNVKENEEAIAILQVCNLQLFLDFIMFDPESTLYDLEQNLNFLRKAGLDTHVPWDHVFSYMTPYLGTKIRDRYEDLLNKTFDDDILPNPIDLFINEDVKKIFIELEKLKTHLEGMEELIMSLDSWLEKTTEYDSYYAQQKLNIVSLKRMPFVVFQKLIAQAKKGNEISYENASLIPIAGRAIELMDVLENIKINIKTNENELVRN